MGALHKHNSLNDRSLIKLLQEGNHLAYAEIYNRYWASMYLYARRLLNDAEVAKDVVQEVMQYIWENSDKIKDNLPIAPYLFSAVRNRVLNNINRLRLKNKYLTSLKTFLEQGEYTADKNIRENELQLAIDKAISALPKKMKMIFELSKVENLSNKEISVALNVSDKTVRNQLSTALKTIKLKITTR